MQTRIEVGILGATGMVGQHFIKFLQGNPWFDLVWLGASDRSAGKKYKDAMTWHLAGGTPGTVANQTVEECKPGNAPKLLFSAMDAGVATDIPAFGGKWGEPFLIGPGTIHVAHTSEERVPKKQLLEAVQIYQTIVKELCKRESK